MVGRRRGEGGDGVGWWWGDGRMGCMKEGQAVRGVWLWNGFVERRRRRFLEKEKGLIDGRIDRQTASHALSRRCMHGVGVRW